jgi:hypothetical protein
MVAGVQGRDARKAAYCWMSSPSRKHSSVGSLWWRSSANPVKNAAAPPWFRRVASCIMGHHRSTLMLEANQESMASRWVLKTPQRVGPAVARVNPYAPLASSAVILGCSAPGGSIGITRLVADRGRTALPTPRTGQEISVEVKAACGATPAPIRGGFLTLTLTLRRVLRQTVARPLPCGVGCGG